MARLFDDDLSALDVTARDIATAIIARGSTLSHQQIARQAYEMAVAFLKERDSRDEEDESDEEAFR